MRVELAGGEVIDLGTTETAPTIGITDYSRRVTDEFGVTTVVERGFARRMSVRLAVPFDAVDGLQRRLADLRATSARWVAAEGIAWLSVAGFYKDFALDLAVPPLSYCTLEVEGLAAAEPFTDPGNDPAPDGRTSTLQLLRPATVNDAALAYSSVAETDHPEWSAGASYAAGARVIRAATHRIYESLVAGNDGNVPEGVSGKWLDLGPTNRWAMFDQALGTVTHSATGIVVVLSAGTINAVALLDVVADAVRVEAAGYDRYATPDGGALTFLDIPATSGLVTVTIAGASPVSIGTLLIGTVAGLGITEAAPTAGITDYSRKEVDEFGEATIVPRAWAKRMATRALIRTDAVDVVANRIAAVRARPSLWVGQAGLDSLTVYGFFKDFSIEVGENVSTLSLSIEGLSTAAPIVPVAVPVVAWPDIADPDGTKPDNGATKGAPPGTYVGGTLAEDIEQSLHDLGAQVDGILDTTPPGVPTGLTISSALTADGLASATFAWTAPPDLDLALHHLEVALSGGNFVRFSAPSTSFVLHSVPVNTTVQARVRAVDKAGNASAFTAVVSATTARDTVPPAPPYALLVQGIFGGFRITWTNPGDADVAKALIWESPTADFANAYLLTTLNAGPYEPGTYSRTGLVAGTTVYYWVAAQDSSGNLSTLIGPYGQTTTALAFRDFDLSVQPIGQVDALPNPAGYTGPTAVRLSTDKKLYRYVGGAWSKDVDGADLVAGSVRSYAIAAQQISAKHLAIADLMNLVPGDFSTGDLSGWTRVLLAGDGNNKVDVLAGLPEWQWPSAHALHMKRDLQTNTGEISVMGGNYDSDADVLMEGGFAMEANDEFYFQAVVFGTNGAALDVHLVNRKDASFQVVTGGIRITPAASFTTYSGVIKNAHGRGKGYLKLLLANNTATGNNSELYVWNVNLSRRNGGKLIVDGGIFARQLNVDDIFATNAFASRFTGGEFRTDASLPGTIGITGTGVTIATVASRADNPAARINQVGTFIDAGKISIQGATPLTSILYGGDNTKIDGGAIAANTVRANSAVIGMRGIQPIDIQFTAEPSTNSISWTAGYIEWQDEAGVRQVTNIPAGSGTFYYDIPIGVLYVWWDRTAAQLWSAMIPASEILANTNNVILAVYRGGTNQIVYWGRTIIDGGYIKADTIEADRLKVNSIEGKYLKIDAISARELGAEAVTTRSLKALTIQAKHFITDEGVDLAAIVPGSLNWRSSAGHGSLPFIGPDQGSGIVASTGVGKCYPGTDVSFGDVEVSWVGGGTSAGDVVDLTVAFAYRIDGGSWIGTGQAKTIRYSVGSYTTLADTTGKSFYLPAVEGQLQLGVSYGVVTSNGFGNPPTGGASIASGSFSAKVVNWK